MSLRRLLTVTAVVIGAGLLFAPHDTVNLIQQAYHAVDLAFRGFGLH